ncbi:MAG TPA: LacI family transcriptional regulator [Firmicutes bacterium]|nr:LacI family transcriptional regulator [Bacillota bacterium]
MEKTNSLLRTNLERLMVKSKGKSQARVPIKVTVYDVARAAGVSPATVSLALKDSPQISKETKERVKATASEMGYVPNFFGRGLVSERTYSIGWLIG